jgi:MYXO-CTERM domain-containing protein
MSFALFALCATMWRGDAHGDGVAQVLTSKSLPPATVAVIDPESGSSSGTSGADVNIAVGDIILFRFSFTPVPDKINRGIQGYLTEYVPPNTEVVGVRFLDENGQTIVPSYPGLAVEGCAGGSLCNNFNNLPSNGGTADFAGGSIAQVHADTGIFYSTSSLTAKNPSDSFITMNGGIEMTPEPRTISPGIVALLNDTTGPYYAHNEWDWTQVQAYGFNMDEANVDGTGNTPYLYGSLISGPDTYYSFEATEVSPGVIEFNDNDGPWQRVMSPGSQTGFGPSETGDDGNQRVNIPTGAGFDITPANPVANATALRFALGETRTGQVKFVEVALRVTGVPIDPNFDPPNGGNIDCGEVVGSDVSARGGNSGGDNNAWPTYVGSPACVFLKLLFDLNVDKVLALGGNTLTYTIDGKNLSVDPETGVLVRLKFDGSRQTYVTSTPAPTSGPATCVDDSTKQCLSYSLGTLQPSDEYQIVAQFSVGGGGQTTNVMVANYASDQLPAPGFDTQAISVVTGIAVPLVTMGPVEDPTVTAGTAGSTMDMVALVANVGTDNFTYETITLPLPTGWRINGSVLLNSVPLSCTAGCGTDTPTYDISSSFVPLEVRTLEFTVDIPMATSADLYTFDAQVWGGQSGFGGDFETYFPEIATVAVTDLRTTKPILDCPVVSSQTAITGTSEADATVRLYFNLIERGDGTADNMGDWSVTNFTGFGELYGGLEVRATAQAPGELESELSDACFVTQVRVCSDGLDNDMDGLIDFPADPGCESAGDGDETDPAAPQCSDGIDNDGSNGADWPDDPSCSHPTDPTEDGVPACSDDVDNDGDGLLDFDGDGNALLIDPDCADANDSSEATLRACQDGIDNDMDGLIDFDGLGTPANADPGCHSDFDDDEVDDNFTPADTEARLLILFDSSGSMNWNTCSPLFTDGDGSLECVGSDVSCATCASSSCSNGIADDSRLAKVKAGISNVVAGFGEVEYGLMRFHQREDDFSCPTANASQNSGGWQGGGAEPCGGGFNAGDLLVAFANENEQTLLGWIDGEDNYEGLPPLGTDYEIRGSGTTPLGGALSSANTYVSGVKAVDPREECRPYRVILVTDGQETCGGDPVTEAAALCNFNAMTQECDDVAVNVIGFATSDPQVNADLNAIAAAGGTTSAILVDDEAALSTAIASIVTETVLVEFCNGDDDDCDGFTDEDFTDLGDDCDNGEEGICFEPGNMVCTSDGFGTECDAPPGTPGTEVCNGLDDDCNGLIDDGLMNCNCNGTQEICNGLDDDCDTFIDEGPLPGNGDDCGLDIGECSFGSLSCEDDGMGGASMECVGGNGPIDETCNGFDDDCDTFVDEVVRECYTFMDGGCTLGSGCTGQCQTGLITCLPMGGGESMCIGEVGATAELCNGLDDDCDGFTDEDYPNLGDTCDNGQLGVCNLPGTIQCTADQLGEECNAPTVTPGIEVCNNFDDDCDGPVDEDLGAPIGDSCGGGADCTPGTLECTNGVVECVGTMGGEAETCNGLDDDCDSFVDEEPLPGTGGQCTDPGFEMFGDTGECEFGMIECIAGGLECSGYIGPTPEICNGLDDDCDGEADQFADCPVPDNMCLDGGCAEPCNMTEFPCPFGFQCKEYDEGRFCIPDQCVGVTCPQGFVCDSDTGECNDLCDGVTCQDGQTCQGGGCFDCFTLGCPDDEICVVGMNNIGTCIPDPCLDVECDEGQFCSDGDCQPLACVPDCPDEQVCIDGQCRVDLCSDVECPNGRICDPQDGDCIGDLCQDINCMSGFACDPGSGVCIPDPCLTIDCPDDFECVVTLDGVGSCREPVVPAEDNDYVYAAGGGCSSGGGTGGAPWAVLALIGLVVIRRRKTVSR